MGKSTIFLLLIVSVTFCYASLQSRLSRRSIDLAAAHSLIPDTRLPGNVQPNCYTLDVRPNFEDNVFGGNVKINVSVVEDTETILLHAHFDLELDESEVKVIQIKPE